MEAVNARFLDNVEFLLAKGADPKQNATPLHGRVRNGFYARAEYTTRKASLVYFSSSYECGWSARPTQEGMEERREIFAPSPVLVPRWYPRGKMAGRANSTSITCSVREGRHY